MIIFGVDTLGKINIMKVVPAIKPNLQTQNRFQKSSTQNIKMTKSGLAALTADCFSYSLETLQTIQMYGVDFTPQKCLGVI